MIGNIRPLESVYDRATSERVSRNPHQPWIWLEEGRLPRMSPHHPDPSDVAVPAPRPVFYHRIPSLRVPSAGIRIQEDLFSSDFSDTATHQVAWRFPGRILVDPAVALLRKPNFARDSLLRRRGSYMPRQTGRNHLDWKPAGSGTSFRPISMELGGPPANLGQTEALGLRCLIIGPYVLETTHMLI